MRDGAALIKRRARIQPDSDHQRGPRLRTLRTWRKLPNPDQWLVTPETARLLTHWRSHPQVRGHPSVLLPDRSGRDRDLARPRSPRSSERASEFWAHIEGANAHANPELHALRAETRHRCRQNYRDGHADRLANAQCCPSSRQQAVHPGFLLLRRASRSRIDLRVLLPNDPDSYYRYREFVPRDMLADLDRAKIVITNYHAFKLRDRSEVSKGTRRPCDGRSGEISQTLETEGQMLQRVMPELMGMKTSLC